VVAAIGRAKYDKIKQGYREQATIIAVTFDDQPDHHITIPWHGLNQHTRLFLPGHPRTSHCFCATDHIPETTQVSKNYFGALRHINEDTA
jgi:hypothetical protein